MPAPDLPPPPVEVIERPLAVHLTPGAVSDESLRGAAVIVIDALRASVTIAAALDAGCVEVMPVLTAADAIARRAECAGQGVRVLLGGERGGRLVEGFDLDNSPANYTPQRVKGAAVVFTTTNGTASLLHARHAARVYVGSLVNVGAVCDAVADETGPVHILCAGTRGEVSMDDCLAAGAMVKRLTARGRTCVSEDSARLCGLAWAAAEMVGVERAMLDSRGGRNLTRLGFVEDVRRCSRVDSINVLPRFDPAAGVIRLEPTRAHRGTSRTE